MDSTGNPAVNGQYFVKVDSISRMGVDTSVTEPVVVNRAVYKVAVKIYNEAGEVVKNLYSYTSNPVSTTRRSWDCRRQVRADERDAGGDDSDQCNDHAQQRDDDRVGRYGGQWGGGGVGAVFHLGSAQDGQGGETVMTGHVMVMSDNANAGMGNLTARPNLLNAGTGYSVQVVSDSGESLTLAFRVYDAAGELVRREVTGPAGSNMATCDAAGLASGVYFMAVDAYNVQGGLVGHKALKIVVVR